MRSVQIDWFMFVRISLIIAVLMAGSALNVRIVANLVYDTILKGKNAMPAFRGVLTEEEFYDVITYIRSFL